MQTYLNAAIQGLEEDVSAFLHELHVPRGGVGMLTVLDGVDKSIGKLPGRTQEVGLHKVDHGPV